MALNREPIDVALLARLNAKTLVSATPAGPMKGWQRRYEPWTSTPPPQDPSGMLIRGAERPEYTQGRMGAIWRLERWLLVYANDSGEIESVVDTLLNAIALAIESALEMQAGEIPSSLVPQFPPLAGAPSPTTLGGLVHYCRIGGTVDTYEGTSGSSFMRFPLEIVATA